MTLIALLVTSGFLSASPINFLDLSWQRYQTNQLSNHVIGNANIPWQQPTQTTLFNINSEYGVVGWFKSSFNYPNPISNPALYIKNIHHSDEVWINGKLVGGTGQLHKPWEFSYIAPHNQLRLYELNDILMPVNNSIVIKVNVGFGEVKGALYPGGIGFSEQSIAIVDATKVQSVVDKQRLNDVFIDASILILSIVDVLLILFLLRHTIHRFPEFKWLIISSIFMLVGVLGLDLPYLMGFAFEQQKLIFMLLMLAMPWLTMMFFISIHQDKRERWFLIGGGIITAIGLLTLVPFIPINIKNICWVIWGFLAKGFYVIALFCAVIGVRKRLVGSVAALIGLLVYMVLIRTQWLPDDFWEHRNIIIGTLFFRYAVLFAYIQRLNTLSVDYQRLSNNMLDTLEEQRKNIARELHDGLGQNLTAAKFQLQLAQSLGHEKHFELVKSELDNGVTLTRKIINGLHLFNLENQTLNEFIVQDTKRLKALYEIDIKTFITGELIPSSSGTHLLRIIQESVSNAVQHGNATQIDIHLGLNNQKVQLMITDDGCGIGESTHSALRGFGHVSIRERVAIINGTISMVNRPQGGTKIHVEFPLV